ncbi:MAG TPA: GNAT family N-acetyltransferase [Microthrixaceae bacterium]|nr:GNAT family N-acetyltransferase [Microthrixaceae bacterium]
MPRAGHVELRVQRTFDGPARDWDDLAASQPLPSPFLRSWWLQHAPAGELVLLCCVADGRLVGGLALERDELRAGPVRLERLRSPGQGPLAPDHLDLVATDEHRDVVTGEVLAWLRRPGSRVVDLDGLAAEGSLAAALADRVVERHGAPFAALPPDAAAYLAARPGRLRSTIQRTAKRLARSGATHRRVPPEDGERALADLARLHEGRWADESSFLAGWERFRRAALAGMQAGEVTIDEIVDADGSVVATELDLLVGGRTAFYQAGRRTEREWRGAGSVLRWEIVQRAVADGRCEYDLLRGDEPYKADWADGRRELVRCRFGVGPLGTAAMAARRWRQAAHELSRAASRRRRAPRPEPTG